MWSAIGIWGCERGGMLDLWNCARTDAYWRRLAPSSNGVTRGGCCPDVQSFLPTPPPGAGYTLGPYTDPVQDGAWWYSPLRPESRRFLGLQVISVVGIDDNSTDRKSSQTGACNGTLLHGPLIDDGYTIVVEGVLRGLDCCSVRYGLEALRQQLRGCGCGGCRGTQLRMIAAAPPDVDAELACDYPLDLGEYTDPWRTIGNVVLKEQPVVTSKRGISCGNCGCGTLTTIRFTLTGDPGLYLDPDVVLGPVTLDAVSDCTVICEDTCPDDADVLSDPFCPTPLLPDPPAVLSDCFCPPLLYRRVCQTISLGDRPFPVELEAEIAAGSADLRNLRVSVWKVRAGVSDDYYTSCNRCAGFAVSYVPAGWTWKRSACSGVTVHQLGKVLDASSTLLRPSGAPGSPCITLPCGDLRVCVDVDIVSSPDATITLSTREVEP